MVDNVIPKSLDEALEHLAKGDYQIINGGTDLMVKNRAWSETRLDFKKNMLYVRSLEALDYIKRENNVLRIGATTSLESLLYHEHVPSVMKECLHLFASPAIRNMATLSGNIGNASPAGDGLLITYLLDGVIVLVNAEGVRKVRINDYVKGPGTTDRRSDEMIKEIQLHDDAFDYTVFNKVGGRASDSISKTSFAGAVRHEKGIIKDIRIAIGAVAATVIKDKSVEHMLRGQSIHQLKEKIPQILEAYEPHIQPIDDQRSNRSYRKKVAMNLLEAFLRQIASKE